MGRRIDWRRLGRFDMIIGAKDSKVSKRWIVGSFCPFLMLENRAGISNRHPAAVFLCRCVSWAAAFFPPRILNSRLPTASDYGRQTIPSPFGPSKSSKFGWEFLHLCVTRCRIFHIVTKLEAEFTARIIVWHRPPRGIFLVPMLMKCFFC